MTPTKLAQQSADSAWLGPWDEYDRTRRDLEQAAERHQQRFVEIDYEEGFDVERDLGSHLRRLGLA